MSEHRQPDTPAAWLIRARSDLALARVALAASDVLLEDVCYHTQQCAEKAIKALLVQRSLEFPDTHVLETLLDLLKHGGVEIPSLVDEAVELTQYAVQARYLGPWEPVTSEEAEFAVRIAAWVLEWVEGQLVGE